MIAFPSLLKDTHADVPDVSVAQGEMQHQQPRSPSMRWSRIITLVIFTLSGICLVSSIGAHHGMSHQHLAAISSTSTSSRMIEQEIRVRTPISGMEQRGQATVPHMLTLPSACGLLDITCDLNSAAQWMAQGIQNAIQPITDAIDHDPSNFISQTPICISGCPTNDSPYLSNGTLSTLVNWSIGIVNVAVATFIALGALNIIAAHHIGSKSASSIAQFLPRIALAVMAANLSRYFLQFFLDLENALCLEVVHLQSLTLLTNTIVGIFHLNLLSAGLIMFVIAIVLAVMNLLLVWQMLVRLALLFLLIVLAPLGLLCFGLPQTQGYGHLWASNFAITVFVQFFQVVALALGGMLATSVSTSGFFGLGQDMTALFVSTAVIYLVLRIPGMVRSTVLGPVAQAGLGTVESVSGIATQLIEVLL